MKLSPRVLIVDASRESREVLRMLLELRGATTIEADGPEQALQLTHTARPDYYDNHPAESASIRL